MKKTIRIFLILSACLSLLSGTGISGAWAAKPVAGGACGDDVYWSLDSSGLFTLTGSGATYDYYYDHQYPENTIPSPWYEQRDAIKTLSVGSGITGLGNYAFYSCRELASVTLPEGLAVLGNAAFAKCSALTAAELPGTLASVGASAFYNCGALENIVLPAGVSRIPANTFLNCGALTDVYYSGTEDEWNAVEVEDGNESLQKAAVHCRAEIYTPGDADGDGRLTVADARITHRISLVPESRQPDTSGFKACDADNDGRITAEDAALIFKAAFGLIAPPVWHF